MEIWGNPGLPFTKVPCLHQSNVYIKSKLQVWRVQKCIPLIGAKPWLTCVVLETTFSHLIQYMAENGNLRKIWCTFFTMVQRLHQSNIYITRKLQVWTVQKCIRLVGAKTALICAGRQPTPSHVSQYSAWNVNLRKSRSTFRNVTVFAPKHCLYQKEAAEM